MIEIIETSYNKFLRILLKAILVWALICGIASLLVLFVLFVTEQVVTLEGYVMTAIASTISIVAIYAYKTNKVVTIKQINSHSIVMRDGSKDIVLTKKDIMYVFKLVRYTFSPKHCVLFFRVESDNVFSIKRYFFVNNSQNDLIEIFKKMHIKVKNLP